MQLSPTAAIRSIRSVFDTAVIPAGCQGMVPKDFEMGRAAQAPAATALRAKDSESDSLRYRALSENHRPWERNAPDPLHLFENAYAIVIGLGPNVAGTGEDVPVESGNGLCEIPALGSIAFLIETSASGTAFRLSSRPA